MIEEYEENEKSKNLRAFRDGACFTGIGSLFSFFPGIKKPIAPASVGLAIPAFKNTFSGEGNALAFNIVGGVATNLLSILLHHGLYLPENLSYFVSAAVLSIGAEALASSYEEPPNPFLK